MRKTDGEKLKTVLLPIEESFHTRIKILIATKKVTMKSWVRSTILEGLAKDETKIQSLKKVNLKNEENGYDH